MPTPSISRSEARPLGLNAYYLHDVTARALLAGTDPDAAIDEVFDVARRMDARIVRTWAFHVGPGPTAIQTGAAELGELGLVALDRVIARAAAAGIGLVLSLANAWDDYGGMRALVAMAGHERTEESDLRFFVSPSARAAYRFGMRAVLTRKSTLDGYVLGTHPAVLAWEPINEPRAGGLDRGGLLMRTWLDSVLTEITALAPGKALSSGEEGLDATLEGRDAGFWREVRAAHLFRRHQSFSRNARAPLLTHPSIHVYPDAWGVAAGRVAETGERFIEESAALAAGKTLFVGEMGALGPERLEHLARWTRAAWSVGAIPALWMLAVPSAAAHRDEYALEASELIAWSRELRR